MGGLEYYGNPIGGVVPKPLLPRQISIDTSNMIMEGKGNLKKICEEAGIKKIAPVLIDWENKPRENVDEQITARYFDNLKGPKDIKILRYRDKYNFANIWCIKNELREADLISASLIELIEVYKKLPRLLNYTRGLVSTATVAQRIYDGWEDYDLFPLINKDEEGKTQLTLFEGLKLNGMDEFCVPAMKNPYKK